MSDIPRIQYIRLTLSDGSVLIYSGEEQIRTSDPPMTVVDICFSEGQAPPPECEAFRRGYLAGLKAAREATDRIYEHRPDWEDCKSLVVAVLRLAKAIDELIQKGAPRE